MSTPNTARQAWKKVQQILGTQQDGVPGIHDSEALAAMLRAAKTNGEWPPTTASATPTSPTPEPVDTSWHEGKASSFADPADVRAFKRCKAQGKSDQECFKVGDNGIGKWGMDTTLPHPMVALPPEDWQHLPRPQGAFVIVEANGQTVRATLQDTMPRKANIKNGAIIDLNPAACAALGLTPPMLVNARWRWV